MKYLATIAVVLLSVGCAGWQRVGSMTMISTRNVDTSRDYELVKRDVEAIAKMKQDDALQQALDQAVRQHPGGEFMMNVSVFVKENGKAVKVIGDVWGIAVEKGVATPSMTGFAEFKVGDAVLARIPGFRDPKRATILGIRPDSAVVEWNDRGRLRVVTLPFKSLTATQ